MGKQHPGRETVGEREEGKKERDRQTDRDGVIFVSS